MKATEALKAARRAALREAVPVSALALTLIFCLGVVYGNRLSLESEPRIIRENSPQYKFINPLLFIDNSGQTFLEFAPLDTSLRDKVNEEIRTGNAENIGIYIRDMNTSHWTGVDENDLFAPSSMLKLVTLLAYLHHGEDDPEVFKQELSYTPVNDPGQYYKPGIVLPPGMHSVRDLLIQMITESDNAAMKSLNDFHPEWLKEVYIELELPDPTVSGDDFMSAEMYSRVFRTLYGSTYLGREYSERALQLLAHTEFDKGLVQGTASTTVSHKFGEHTLVDTAGGVVYRELHDCGIVYATQRPYFICIMTRGQDFPKLEKTIGDISTVVYKFMNKAQ